MKAVGQARLVLSGMSTPDHLRPTYSGATFSGGVGMQGGGS